jgi:LacI family transcriptional regulator
VGFVAGSHDSPDSVARVVAFRQAIEELGATLKEVDLLESDWTSAGGETAMQTRLRLSDPLPQAFACANDQTAVGVIYALNAAGLKIPDDVVVTGFDDITLTRYFNPPLTTIRQSGGLLGEAAVDALVAMLDGSEVVNRTVVLPTELVVRGSCGCVTETEIKSPLAELVTLRSEVS